MNEQTFAHPLAVHASPAVPQGAQAAKAAALTESRISRAAERGVAVPLNSRVWRDIALLALQGLATGLVASLLLGLAVFAVA